MQNHPTSVSLWDPTRRATVPRAPHIFSTDSDQATFHRDQTHSVELQFNKLVLTEFTGSSGTTPEVSYAKTLFCSQPYELDDLNLVEDNWDGEGAAKPSPKAIAEARAFAGQARALALTVTSIDPDAVGGVDVYLEGLTPGRKVWCVFRNTGALTVVCDDNNSITVESERGALLLDRIHRFLGAHGRQA